MTGTPRSPSNNGDTEKMQKKLQKGGDLENFGGRGVLRPFLVGAVPPLLAVHQLFIKLSFRLESFRVSPSNQTFENLSVILFSYSNFISFSNSFGTSL